ncbi:hypothetical protein F5X99DRAFT_430658 [Biscogniauxia marginata]|nr:hypothetical protein F5X99DRAFT_430658 [Biscogniauxia marginata]
MEDTVEFACANWSPDNQQCSGVGKFACKGCFLVLYCGPSCQRSHWRIHKIDCRHALRKPDWIPQWEIEDRRPAFMDPYAGFLVNKGKDDLWGSTPAFDILNLKSNEGINYSKDLDLLLAGKELTFQASGDMRNVVQTVVSIPMEFQNSTNFYLNDENEHVVARNAIMLLLALTEDDTAVATENIMHLWYSAFISKSLLRTLQTKIRELVQDVCVKIEGKPSNTILGKTWTFGSKSLRLILTKRQWYGLCTYLEIPHGLTTEKAQEIRRKVTLSPSEVDWRELLDFAQHVESHRLCRLRFREDGVLRPFGSPRDKSLVPNPTLFRDTKTWPLWDTADPLNGWKVFDYLKARSTAKNDLYGKFIVFLKSLLGRFHRRMHSLKVSFRLLNVDYWDLKDALESGKYLGVKYFDRIEMSHHFLAHGFLFNFISGMLKGRSENPHATTITLFNRVIGAVRISGDEEILREYINALQYFPLLRPESETSTAKLSVVRLARTFVRDVDKYFNLFVMTCTCELFRRAPASPGVRNNQEAIDEFMALLGSGNVTGCERYVEWKLNAANKR